MAKIFIDSDALAAAASMLLRLGATEVFVFGSATRDGLRPGSDIDMAVRGLPPSVETDRDRAEHHRGPEG